MQLKSLLQTLLLSFSESLCLSLALESQIRELWRAKTLVEFKSELRLSVDLLLHLCGKVSFFALDEFFYAQVISWLFAAQLMSRRDWVDCCWFFWLVVELLILFLIEMAAK